MSCGTFKKVSGLNMLPDFGPTYFMSLAGAASVSGAVHVPGHKCRLGFFRGNRCRHCYVAKLLGRWSLPAGAVHLQLGHSIGLGPHVFV